MSLLLMVSEMACPGILPHLCFAASCDDATLPCRSHGRGPGGCIWQAQNLRSNIFRSEGASNDGDRGVPGEGFIPHGADLCSAEVRNTRAPARPGSPQIPGGHFLELQESASEEDEGM